jgi:Bacterial Ig-like domain (group 1)
VQTTTPGVLFPNNNGGLDGWLARYSTGTGGNPDSQLSQTWLTYYGTIYRDNVRAIALEGDSGGTRNIYLTGAIGTSATTNQLYVARLNSVGTASTFMSTSFAPLAASVALDQETSGLAIALANATSTTPTIVVAGIIRADALSGLAPLAERLTDPFQAGPSDGFLSVLNTTADAPPPTPPPAASPSQSTITVSPNSVVANGVAAVTVQVTLRSASGTLLPNRRIQWSVSGSQNTLTPAGPWTTNGSGVASIQLTSTSAGIKDIRVVDRYEYPTISRPGDLYASTTARSQADLR